MICNSTTFYTSDPVPSPKCREQEDICVWESLRWMHESWLEGVRLCALVHDRAVALLPKVIRVRFDRRSAPRWKQGRFKSKT